MLFFLSSNSTFFESNDKRVIFWQNSQKLFVFVCCYKTGLSPLAPGQWKGFLAVYFGFFVFNNIVRPVRVAVSIGVSPLFDKIIVMIQEKFRVNKAAAVGITVFFANIVCTISFMSTGIIIASILAGVPVFPMKKLL